MKIDLKNIKYTARGRQKVYDYEASLYVDDKKIGVVQSGEFGGPQYFDGDIKAYREVNDWCKANLPKIPFHGKVLDTNIDMMCAKIVDAHLAKEDLKSKLKSKVLVARENETGVIEYSWRGVRKVGPQHVEAIQRDEPNAKILNTLPLEEALKIYRSDNRPDPEVEPEAEETPPFKP